MNKYQVQECDDYYARTRAAGDYVSITVKGNAADALRAAREHGIPVSVQCEISRWPETVLRTTPEYRQRVAMWFCESPVECGKSGYPRGTLLHYVEHGAADTVNTAAPFDRAAWNATVAGYAGL